MPNKILLTPGEVSERTGLAVSTLAKMRVRGDGPLYLKVGARVRYIEAELEEWLAMKPVHRSTATYCGNAARTRTA